MKRKATNKRKNKLFIPKMALNRMNYDIEKNNLFIPKRAWKRMKNDKDDIDRRASYQAGRKAGRKALLSELSDVGIDDALLIKIKALLSELSDAGIDDASLIKIEEGTKLNKSERVILDKALKKLRISKKGKK